MLRIVFKANLEKSLLEIIRVVLFRVKNVEFSNTIYVGILETDSKFPVIG